MLRKMEKIKMEVLIFWINGNNEIVLEMFELLFCLERRFNSIYFAINLSNFEFIRFLLLWFASI